MSSPMTPRTIIGLDLGQAQDPSALVVIQEAGTDEGRPIWNVPLLKRWELGTSYLKIVEDVAVLATNLSGWRIPLALPPVTAPELVIDHTGVGRPVHDIFVRAQLLVSVLAGITITGGHSATKTGPNAWNVAKKNLVGAAQFALQSRRLRVLKTLPEADTLVKELQNFKVKITTAANETFEAWRENDTDDLVLATAIALWYGEQPKRVARAEFIAFG